MQSFFFLTLVILAAFVSAEWSSCNNDDIKLDDVQWSPNPARSGQQLIVSVKGHYDSDEQITDGRIITKGKFDRIIPFHDNSDLCKALTGGRGPFTAQITANLPSILPKGNLKVRVIIQNQNGREIGCLDASIDVSRSAMAKAIMI